LLHDRFVVAILSCALALSPGIFDPRPGHARAAEASGTSPSLPARTASGAWLAIVEARPSSPHKKSLPPFGVRVADYARRFIGVRYVYGGSNPSSGFDCSGFVRYVYAHFGVSLAHSSYAQFAYGRTIAQRALRPGDLVFFDGIGHVGIYVGHGRFIHAPHSNAAVQIETLSGWYGSRFDGARRVVRPNANPGRRPSAASSRRVADGIRTHDHRDHNPGLYQLSYRHRGRYSVAAAESTLTTSARRPRPESSGRYACPRRTPRASSC
jgi:hypothetical protein